MGTRADFYVGTGRDAEWIGSIEYDGHPDWKMIDMQRARSERAFRHEVAKILRRKNHCGIRPSNGWPWPWDTSDITDVAYAYCSDGRVRVWDKDGKWQTMAQYRNEQPGDWPGDLPNMAARRGVIRGMPMLVAVPGRQQ